MTWPFENDTGGIGILSGVLPGIGGGLLLFPKGFHGTYYGMAVILTAVACWLMVAFSVSKPVKIAANIPPMEAVRYSAGQEKIHSRKKHRKLSPVSMGVANFQRDRKKSVSIAVSLSLGGILFLVVSSIALARSPEQVARLFFPDGDYKLYLSSEQPEEEIMTAGNPLNEELRQEILSVDGVRSVLVTRQSLHGKFRTSASAEAGMCDMLTDTNRMEVEAALVSGCSNLGLDTIDAHIKYEKMQSSIIFGSLQALSWLVFLFGVVNLINTTLSNQMSRKKESSILRSIGLTGKQLCRMNIIEGMCYAFFAAFMVLILGLPLSVAVCVEVSKKSFAGTVVPYQFPFLQMGLFLLVLFGMEVILSVWLVHRQKKQSLVEQMRAIK